MNKQNVILKTQTDLQGLEVIGEGDIPDQPCQIGEWWVMPADQYTGVIPPEIMRKWENFKALNIPVLGYLIADDMRDVIQKRERAAAEQQRAREAERAAEAERQRQELDRQRRNEAIAHTVKQSAEVGGKVILGVGTVVGAVVVGVAMAAVTIIGAILSFDPILIAVLPDGRWICLGAWWD